MKGPSPAAVRAGRLAASTCTDLRACQVRDAAATAVVSAVDAGDRELDPRAGRRTVPKRDVVMQLVLLRSGQHHPSPCGVVEAAYNLGAGTDPDGGGGGVTTAGGTQPCITLSGVYASAACSES